MNPTLNPTLNQISFVTSCKNSKNGNSKKFGWPKGLQTNTIKTHNNIPSSSLRTKPISK